MAYDTDFDPSVTIGQANVGAVAGTTSTFTSTASSAGMINGKYVTDARLAGSHERLMALVGDLVAQEHKH